MTFASDIKRITDAAKDKIEAVDRKLPELALDLLISLSPVGDPSKWQSPPPLGYFPGTFRANWNVAIGAPNESVNLGNKDESGAATFAAGMAVIEGMQPDSTVFITNSVPYARPLEYGHSTQAPEGVVRVTIGSLPADLARYVSSVKS